MFGDHFQPGKGTGCYGELHAPPSRPTSASNSSRTCPPHRVVSFESHGAGAAGAHARGRRARRLSVRNLSTIDQRPPASVGTLPYALHLVLDPPHDLSDLLPICPPSVDLREQQQQPPEVPERPAGGGVVGSGPPGVRVPAEAWTPPPVDRGRWGRPTQIQAPNYIIGWPTVATMMLSAQIKCGY